MRFEKKKNTAVVQRVVKSQKKKFKFCHNDHSFQEVHETENLPLYLSKEVS